MVVEELEYSGIWGALPDWRQIQKLPEDILCAEITKLGGTPCEGRRFLCNQLENLNRTLNLGLSERFAQGCLDPLPWERVVPTDQELAQQVQQAEAAVRATEASPDLEENMGSPFSPGLQPLATMPGVSPSPAVGTTQLGLGSYTQASTSTELSASAALSLEPSQLALEGSSYPFLSSNPQVRINPEAALAIAGSNLRDCVDFQDGVCSYTLLFTLSSVGALSKEQSAQDLPFGCLPTVEALNRVHAAIAPKLLAASRVHTLSDFMRLIHKLISQCAVPVVWTSSDFILPEAATASTVPLEKLGSLTMSVSPSLYKIAHFLHMVGGVGLGPSRTFESNAALKALHDDLLTPRQAQGGGGGLLPQELAHLAQTTFGASLAFENFLEFPNVPNFVAPFDLLAYFRLRATEEGIRNGNPVALDGRILELLQSQTAGLSRLRRLFFDTPPDELVALINALKSILLDPSTLPRTEANSLPVLRALDARLADFESVLPPLAHLRNDLHEMCASSAQARLDEIRRLQTTQRNLSRSSSGSTSSSYAGSSDASAHHISLAGHKFAPLLTELQQLPASLEGNRRRVVLAATSGSSLVINALHSLPSQ